jgi:hypothetical protein
VRPGRGRDSEEGPQHKRTKESSRSQLFYRVSSCNEVHWIKLLSLRSKPVGRGHASTTTDTKSLCCRSATEQLRNKRVMDFYFVGGMSILFLSLWVKPLGREEKILGPLSVPAEGQGFTPGPDFRLIGRSSPPAGIARNQVRKPAGESRPAKATPYSPRQEGES